MSLRNVAIVAIVAASPALAPDPPHPTAVWYARDLTRLCKADGKSGEYAMCWSFIGAVLEIAMNNSSIYGLRICVPPLVNEQKAVAVTTKWLGEHPNEDTQPASLAAAEAFAAAFPCGSSN